MCRNFTLSVYDDIHNQNATGIKYDLWRINSNSNRVNIKNDIIISDVPHVLLQVNTMEELGSFEIILYVKDYFDRFNENIHVTDSRLIIPFGINDLDRDFHLNIFIRPDGYACTL